jgi:hypothetical protein
MSSICHHSVFVLSPATIPPAYERFVAYAIVGILFGLAYRGRAFMALVIVVGFSTSPRTGSGDSSTSLRRHPAVSSEC